MRVAFVGVSSTGKTTVSTLASSILGLPLVVEQVNDAREWCSNNGRSIVEWPPAKFTVQDKVNFEYGMIACQQENERTTFNQHDGFVADSAQLVQLMYWMYYVAPHVSEEETHKVYTDCLDYTMWHYDHIFYLPRLIPVVNDGFRMTNEYELKTLDFIMQGILSDLRAKVANAKRFAWDNGTEDVDRYVKIHQLSTADRWKRVQYIMENVNKV
jgi:hypothetical protein